MWCLVRPIIRSRPAFSENLGEDVALRRPRPGRTAAAASENEEMCIRDRVSAMYGSNYPAHGYSNLAAFWMELILTMGLVSVILGTASGAQNIGIIGAFGVGGYIALAGLWGSPISGASMNPARTFGPCLLYTSRCV